MATTNEERRYKELIKDVKSLEIIDLDTMWMLIRRHIQGYTGRRFFNDKLKMNYYKFWIKRLENGNIIKSKTFGMWEVQ